MQNGVERLANILIKTNYHTHCSMCNHAEGLPSDYIQKAMELGMEEIGISCHGPLLPIWEGDRMSYQTFLNKYLPDIKNAKEKYHDKIKIYSGLELEYVYFEKYLYEALLEKVDYLILGQHIICDGYKIYDGRGMDPQYLELYCQNVVDGLDTGYFKILAHPDIFFYFAKCQMDENIEKLSRKIIEAAIKNNVYLELNVNGARRGKILNKNGETTWQYPYLDFWRLVSQYKDAKVVINADCHYLNYLYDDVTEEVIAFAKELKLNICDRVDFK